MKFSRRSFFGILPGAALGGKQAAAALAAEAEKLAGVQALGASDTPYPQPSAVQVAVESSKWAAARLDQFFRPAERARRWDQTSVNHLDPDLVSMRSMSLSARMTIQKQRNFDRHEMRERSYLEGVIAGIFD